MRLYDGKQYNDHVLHMALEKCVKQIDALFLVLTKLNKVRSSDMVKVFALYHITRHNCIVCNVIDTESNLCHNQIRSVTPSLVTVAPSNMAKKYIFNLLLCIEVMQCDLPSCTVSIWRLTGPVRVYKPPAPVNIDCIPVVLHLFVTNFVSDTVC